jgi:L-fuculose-phosphate aldolase
MAKASKPMAAKITGEARRRRQEIIDACNKMNALGINQGTSGNISVRDGDGLLITPTSLPYDIMRPEDIVSMRFDGSVSGSRQPSSEWRFHLDILKAKPEANAVVHAHPPYCTTIAILGRNIPPLHYMVAVAGGDDIRCAPYATFGTEALSAHALKALEGRKACLLAHHGMIATGTSLANALWLAVEVETLARQYHGCLQLGEPPLLSSEEIRNVIARMATYGHKD